MGVRSQSVLLVALLVSTLIVLSAGWRLQAHQRSPWTPRIPSSTAAAAAAVSTTSPARSSSDYSCLSILTKPTHRRVSTAKQLSFVRKGHLPVRQLLRPEFVGMTLRDELLALYKANMLSAYRHNVRVMLDEGTTADSDSASVADSMTLEQCEDALSGLPEGSVPFMQLFNLWRNSTIVRSVSLSPELGEIAARLLGVKSVRLYQDALFVKRSGDGPTCWHSDLNMSPFDTNDFITCWIPLQDVPRPSKRPTGSGGTGMSYATGSHWDLSLPYWYDMESKNLNGRYKIEDHGKYTVGDCSFHHGWCHHSAPPNFSVNTRYALAISYVADGVTTLQQDGLTRFPDDEDSQSYSDWIQDVGWGNIADHAMLPVVYPKPAEIPSS